MNEKRIVFAANRNITLSKLIAEPPLNSGKQAILEWLQTFEINDKTQIVLEHKKAEEQFASFRSVFKEINAAGGIVKKEDKLLFIFRNGKWDLPKGKIDPGETNETAALREVEEECGIAGHQILKKLPSTYHIYRSPYKESKGKWIFKETFWFEMEYDGNKNGVPQEEEGITQVRWFAANELEEVLANTYENLKQIIKIYRA